MTSPNQLTANQANAQLSTGPRTPDGKAASSQNARTHGLRSAQAMVHEHEMDEYHAMRDGLLAEICPQGALQMILFEQLLHAAWNQRRCRRMEAVLVRSSPHHSVDPMECLSLQGQINLIERYHRRAKQDFNRALAEIRKMQTEQAYREATAAAPKSRCRRKGSPILPQSAVCCALAAPKPNEPNWTPPSSPKPSRKPPPDRPLRR